MFLKEQIDQLSARLDPRHVKSRDQAGRKLSYVEGWHAIAEANRIFGFAAWDRQLVALKQLGDPRDVNGKMRVGYLATVRIIVRTDGGEVYRDGTGFGSGIDKDVDQAHESAIKEAETDAMKRALMTFGNPFGLALYDKDQANVGFPDYQFSDNPPPGVNADLWETAFARADGGMNALSSWWAGEATKSEKHALAPWKDDFKAHAAKQKDAE